MMTAVEEFLVVMRNALSGENVLIWSVALASAIAVLMLVPLFDSGRKKRAARLHRVSNGADRASLAVVRNSIIRRRDGEAGLAGSLARLVPQPKLLAGRLSRTGKPLGPGIYAIICIGCAIGSGGVLHLWGGLPPLATLLGGIALGLLLPHLWVGRAIDRREAAFLKNLPEGIDVMVRGLKAGLPITESLAAAGKEASEPVGGIFRAASDLIRMGRPIEEAIEKTAERMSVPELRFLAITLSVQKETGGNLTETLANLSDILRRRRQMKLKVRAVSSEARASAMILGSLPFVMFAILLLVNRGYVMQLFDDPRGHMLVGVGLGSIAAGILVMAKMIKFDI